MKRAFKYISMILLTVGITLLCLFLPSEISKLQDRHTFGSIHLEKTDDIVVKSNQMTILEKLNLFINLKKVSMENEIRHGKYLKEEELPDICMKEIKKLEDIGVLNNINIDFKLNDLKIQPAYFWSLEDPAKSVIVWKVYYIGQKNYLKINLDDETGKILSLEGDAKDNYVNTDEQEFVKGLGSYYGISENNFIINKVVPDNMSGSNNQESVVTVTLSDNKTRLNLDIQIFPFGWFYTGN